MVKTSLNITHLLRESKREKDLISQLPNELLCKILSNLTTKDSIRASVLSKRWRNMWLNVPALDLDITDFEDEMECWDFFDRFLKSNKDQKVTRFELAYNSDDHNQEDFESRVDDVLKRGVCNLNVENWVDFDEALVRMPLSLYSCATLVNLKLHCVDFDYPQTIVISLPCLQTMYLDGCKFDGDQTLETLISSCLVLEELVIILHRDDLMMKVVCVRSQSLKEFILKSERGEERDEDEHPGDPRLEIDAPRLEYMDICKYQTNSFIIHNIGHLTTVNIDFVVCVEYDDSLDIIMMRNILNALSTVGEMIISARTLEMIYSYCELEEQVPQFQNLSKLHAYFLDNAWEELQTFLGHCPNMHSLYLHFECLPEPEAVDLSFVPQCFLTSLEYVELRSVVKASDKNLAMYFLRYAAILKKLTLTKSFENIIKKIIGIPKRSPKCEIVILSDSA